MENEISRISNVDINKEMREAYLQYSMSCHRRARPAGCSRRAEAGASAGALRDERVGSGATTSPSTPSRRVGGRGMSMGVTTILTAISAVYDTMVRMAQAVFAALSAGGRAGQFRFGGRRRSRRPSLH
jgi:hypothetical protein